MRLTPDERERRATAPGRVCFALFVGILLASCGSRTELPAGAFHAAGGGGGGPAVDCDSDAQCPFLDICQTSRCVANTCRFEPISCDDGNDCSEDVCESGVGCLHRDRTFDADADGHRAPLAGFFPGAPGACGDDCDDTNPQARPGGFEICDATDNDCNGVVDDGARYVPGLQAPVRLSFVPNTHASHSGFVATESDFVVSYTAVADRGASAQATRSFLKSIDAQGTTGFDVQVSDVNADTYAGALAWSGRDLAVAWEDARQEDNYEIYFNRFNPLGEKLESDLRVTDARLFSLNAAIAWNRSEFVLAWDDRRDQRPNGADMPRLYGQRISAEGRLLGENRLLVGDDPQTESPAIGLGPDRIGIAYRSVSAASTRLGFRVFDAELAPVGSRPERIGEDVESPSVQWVGDRFVVTWHMYRSVGGTYGFAVWAAAYDREGAVIAEPRPVTTGSGFVRSHATLSLGDRILLVWAQGTAGYDLYFQLLSPELRVLADPQRLTFDSLNNVDPRIAAGPSGKIGVLFESQREQAQQIYFTTLECLPLTAR